MDIALRKAIVEFAHHWNLENDPPENTHKSDRDYIDPQVFEIFSAHHVLNTLLRLGLDQQEILTVVTGGRNDAKIDALALMINDVLVTSIEDIEVFDLNNSSKEIEVTFIFIQSTMREYLSQGKIDNFCTGISNFLGEESRLKENEQIVHWRLLKEEILALLAHRGIDAKPRCRMFLTWPERLDELPEDNMGIVAIRTDDFKRTGFFSEFRFDVIDGPDLLELVKQEEIANEAFFAIKQRVELFEKGPRDPGIGRGWLGWMRASDYLKTICRPDGTLRSDIFYENVRHFQTSSSAPINNDIAATLNSDRRGEFVLRNNGITIIAKEAIETSWAGGEGLILRDFQIVNGCQTSHVLYDCRDFLDESVGVSLKIICTQDNKVIHNIAVATNSQTNINADQLLSRKPYIRQLQQHFDTLRGSNGSCQIWFERRSGEHAAIRHNSGASVVDIADLMRMFASVYLEIPHTVQSSGWDRIRRMVAGGQIFSPKHEPDLYYSGSLILMRARQLMHNLPGGERRYPARNHLLLAIRYLADPPSGWSDRNLKPKRSPELRRYLTVLKDVLCSDKSSARVVGQAHDIVMAAYDVRNLPATAINARQVEMTSTVVDLCRKERSVSKTQPSIAETH